MNSANGHVRGLRIAAGGVTPREAMAEFLESLHGSDRKLNTIIYYRSSLRQFVSWMETEDVRLPDITGAQMRRFFVYRELECGVTRTTLYHDWTAARKFVQYCRRQEWIETDPMVDLRFRKPRPAPPDVPTEDTVAALLQAIRDRADPKKNPNARKTADVYRIRIMRRDYCAALALFETGARRGEILSLNYKQLRDLDTSAPYLLLQHTKTGEDRIAFVSEAWVDAWKDYKRVRPKAESPDECIWHGEYGEPLSAGWFTKKIASYREWAGLPRITPQHLRRYRASRLVQNKTDLYAASEILGNSPEVLRRSYLEKNPEHLRARWQESMEGKAIITAKTARKRKRV